MNNSLMQGAWPEAAPAPQQSTDDASLFLLQHAGQHVHARGCRATLPAGALATLAERVSAFFAQQRGGPGLLVGAVPFEPRADDALYQPERLLPALALQPQAAPPLDGALRAEPVPQDYAAAVAAAVQALRAPEQNLHKVVLARSLLARTREALSPDVLLARRARIRRWRPTRCRFRWSWARRRPGWWARRRNCCCASEAPNCCRIRWPVPRGAVPMPPRTSMWRRRCWPRPRTTTSTATWSKPSSKAGTVLQPHRCTAAPGAACHRQHVAPRHPHPRHAEGSADVSRRTAGAAAPYAGGLRYAAVGGAAAHPRAGTGAAWLLCRRRGLVGRAG